MEQKHSRRSPKAALLGAGLTANWWVITPDLPAERQQHNRNQGADKQAPTLHLPRQGRSPPPSPSSGQSPPVLADQATQAFCCVLHIALLFLREDKSRIPNTLQNHSLSCALLPQHASAERDRSKYAISLMADDLMK